MMSDFEPFDDDLAVALRHRAPDLGTTALGTAHAHDAVLVRARGIRRRRAAIAGGATLAAVIAGGVFLLNGNSDDTLAPATAPSTSIAPDTSPAPSTTGVTPSVASPTSMAESVSSSTTDAASNTVAPATALESGQPTPTDAAASSTSSSSSSSSSSSTSLAPQGPAPFTKTYSSAGGSITVSWSGTALSLDAVNPAAGETSEIEDNSATRIRVRFRGTEDARIEVRYENGQVTERID